MPISASLPTALGRFILSADENGLCGLTFPAESPSTPSAALVDIANHPLLQEAGRQLLAYLVGDLHTFNLPLSIHGTLFRQQVWAQLLTIPYGQTMTYGQLAERIGSRNKARAVGGAAHANPLGIIIPCHRLIGTGGQLTGFGGGLPMKQALLELEQRFLGQTKKSA
jgi:methylated-DNA-[protein]-cysteine S-methyltransferase